MGRKTSAAQPKITIVGTGSMACLLGAHLGSVAPVTLTGSWAEGIAAISRTGIKVEGPGFATPVHVAAVPWSGHIEPADLVLVLVKAWQTEEVARRLDQLLKPDGIALTLQNGLGNLEALGPRTCLGVTHLGATMLRPGRVQPAGSGSTWIAAPDWVVRLFLNTGLAVEQTEPAQVNGLLWGKLVINCGINALTALLAVRNGELLQREDTMSLMRQAAIECAEVARAKGIRLPFQDAAEKVCEVAHLTAINYSSMLQDLFRGAPTECEAINGAVVRWGNRLCVPTPVNEVLFRLVRTRVALASSGLIPGHEQPFGNRH